MPVMPIMPPVPPLQTASSLLGRLKAHNDPVIGISRANTAASLRSPVVDDDPMEDYAVPYGDGLDDWNERLGLMWNQIMDKGRYSTSASYTQIQVLMLSHDAADNNDDLHVREEMNNLQAVFRDVYNFGVTRKTIRKHHKMHKRSQAQVNAIVAKWAYEHDGPSTLLIVYFAGHGSPSEHGELELVGRQELTHQVGAEFNKVVWDNTERNLHYLIADVLQIFDCCYAGTMSAEHRDEDQTIEFLAACRGDEETRKPGSKSFTSALIWSLKELARQGGRFTVNHLLRKIERAPNFPTNQQHPTLIRRARKPRHQRIIIHTLQNKKTKSESPRLEADTAEVPGQARRYSEEQYVLDLKFAFHSWPTDQDINHLGQDLNTSVISRKLPMSHISWGGIQTKQALARQAVQILRGLATPPIPQKREREDDIDENDVSTNLKRAVTGIESIGEQLHQYHDEFVQTTNLKDLIHHTRDIQNGEDANPLIDRVPDSVASPETDTSASSVSTI